MLLVLLLTIFGCQKKFICPAYQSSFLLDEKKTNSFFSLFNADSLPKSNFRVNKNDYGIIEKMKYHRKVRSLETVAKTTIYPDSQDSLLLAERDILTADSLGMDSLFLNIPMYQYKFNRDQLVYMRYIGSKLPGPKPVEESGKEIVNTTEPTAPEEEETKKSWWPFGRKKDKDQEETAPEEEEKEDDFDDDFDDEETEDTEESP
jgi:hypothetical protein